MLAGSSMAASLFRCCSTIFDHLRHQFRALEFDVQAPAEDRGHDQSE